MIDTSSSLKSENNYKMAESIYDKLCNLFLLRFYRLIIKRGLLDSWKK